MLIRDQNQALSVAVGMEKRAIRVYERALMIVQDDAVAAGIRGILADEREHLRRFSAMRKEDAAPAEDKILTDAMAADALFEGGVMSMVREKALADVESTYAYAAQSERQAVETYNAMAEKCVDEDVKKAFRSIAMEEAGHLAALNRELNKIRKGE